MSFSIGGVLDLTDQKPFFCVVISVLSWCISGRADLNLAEQVFACVINFNQTRGHLVCT